MATQTRAPTSDIDATGTWTGSASTRYQAVDDYPDTAGTDKLTHGTATAGHINFGFSAFTVPAGSTAISVQVLYYDAKAGSPSCNLAAELRIGSTPTVHAVASHNPANGVITQRTDDFGATNPKSAAAWTVNDVNGVGTNGLVGFGVVSTDANPAIDLTSIQLQVTYTDPVAALDQEGFRFRNDDGSETTATWLAALNTNASLAVDTTYRLRMLIQNATVGAISDVDLEWQYNLASAGWNNITTSSSVIRAVASANFVDGDDCTQQLGSGTFLSNNDGMTEDGTAGGANLDFTTNQETETELCFQVRSADVTHGQTIQFRLTRDGGTVLSTYTRTPTATVSIPDRAQVSWVEFQVPATSVAVETAFASIHDGAVQVLLEYVGTTNSLDAIIATNSLGRAATCRVVDADDVVQDVNIPDGSSSTRIALSPSVVMLEGTRVYLVAT